MVLVLKRFINQYQCIQFDSNCILAPAVPLICNFPDNDQILQKRKRLSFYQASI